MFGHRTVEIPVATITINSFGAKNGGTFGFRPVLIVGIDRPGTRTGLSDRSSG